MSEQQEREVGIPVDEVPRGTRGERPLRRPRLVPFLATGALLGSFLGLLLVVFGTEVEDVSIGRETIILGGMGALLGGLVGAIAYLVAERVITR
ncbi:hypothetical protein [Ornithinicoccus hortensis]|uniref:Uncharacterized protein n=1 Tax=Ornithinicoccus hortensis TaxID=82346 RepID=A0A542YNJ5_9MICO|nr:hypothetical protein [Ornithinicoccus hortensis]TQL49685.1 hypothetical protein FB467_0772 [Ornithinicoccus hortensis]